jgi:hypothetical protein
MLLPGAYTVKVAFGDGEGDLDTVDDAIQFDIVADAWSGSAPTVGSARQGLVWQPAEWKLTPGSASAAPEVRDQ